MVLCISLYGIYDYIEYVYLYIYIYIIYDYIKYLYVHDICIHTIYTYAYVYTL